MSTKIYNGYRAKINSIDDFIRISNQLRSQCTDKSMELFKEYIARRIIGLYDDFDNAITHIEHHFHDHEKEYERNIKYYIEKKSLLKIAFETASLMYKLDKTCMTHSFDIYIHCEFVLIPTNDYMYIFDCSQNKEYTKILTNIDGVEEYMYWDNTDQPEDISDEDWNKRDEVWATVMPDYIPSNHGVLLDITPANKFLYFDYKELLPIINSDENKEYRKNKIAAREMDKYIPDDVKSLIENSDSHVYEYLNAMSTWSKSDEYKTKIEKIKADLVIDDLTYDDIK